LAYVAFTERVLSYLNNCDKIQLMAIANIKDASAEVILQHRPFASLAEARDVVMTSKHSRKKASKIAIGDDVVDAVEEFARALDGIDHIVGECDRHGQAIKAAASRWKTDLTGGDKTNPEDDKSGPPTPTSLEDNSKAQLQELPIPCEPQLMQGHCKMKSYQLYGLNWMHLLYERNFGGILADDMGLGKTCQVISLICAVVERWNNSEDQDDDNRPWPNLIVVPPSTLSNWEAEFKRFAPGLNVTLYRGSQVERDEIAEEIMENPADCHVILTSYTQLGRGEDIDNMRHVKPMMAVFDEGHKLKNPKTKLYRDLIRITATWRLLLTGTPVQNNLMEMIALLQFIEPGLFQEHFHSLETLFNQKVSLEDVSKGALLFSERVSRARSILEPFILQRRKEQVLKAMPPKTTTVVKCDLDESQRPIYEEFERRFKRGKMLQRDKSTAASMIEDKVPQSDSNNTWMQLRKSAIHSQLFRRYFDDAKIEKMAKILMTSVDQHELKQDNIVHLIGELKNCSDFELHLWCRDHRCIGKFDVPAMSWTKSGKVQKLLELIRQYQENGDRVLVFTRFAKVLEILAECLASENIDYLSLQGNTDVRERQDLIDHFNSDPSVTAFLLTTGAGGTGINLTAANKVIIFDQSDNPQDDVQAENRAHRLGQTRAVEVIKLVSRDTIEELVLKACEKKIELANRVTGWSGVTADMAAGEMEEVIRKELMARDNVTPPSSD
jgi:SWI/SNF-related matrix-associated actin-dependent regulator 1 of chromatin subfamily A